MLFLLIYFPPLFLFTSDTLFHCILFLQFLFWITLLLPTLFLLTHFLFYLFFSVPFLLPNPFFFVYLFLHSFYTSLPLLLHSLFTVPYHIHIFHSSYTWKPLFVTSIIFPSSFFQLVSSPLYFFVSIFFIPPLLANHFSLHLFSSVPPFFTSFPPLLSLVKRRFSHVNPTADVVTTIRQYKAYLAEHAYSSAPGMFWGIPRPGDSFDVLFAEPLRVARVVVLTGAVINKKVGWCCVFIVVFR